MAQAPLLETPPTMAPTRARYTVLAWFCTLSMITYIDRVCIMQVQEPMMLDDDVLYRLLLLVVHQSAQGHRLFARRRAAAARRGVDRLSNLVIIRYTYTLMQGTSS